MSPGRVNAADLLAGVRAKLVGRGERRGLAPAPPPPDVARRRHPESLVDLPQLPGAFHHLGRRATPQQRPPAPQNRTRPVTRPQWWRRVVLWQRQRHLEWELQIWPDPEARPLLEYLRAARRQNRPNRRPRHGRL